MMSKCSSHNSLYALILLAQYHNITVNAETIRHQYNTHTQDFGVTEWLLAAKSIGLKSKICRKTFFQIVNNFFTCVDMAG